MCQRLFRHHFNHFFGAVLDLADIAASHYDWHRGFFGDTGDGVGVTQFYSSHYRGHFCITLGRFHLIEVFLRLVSHVLQHHVFGALTVRQIDRIHQLGEQGRNLADCSQFQPFFASLLEITGKEHPVYGQVAALKFFIVLAIPVLDVFRHERVFLELGTHVVCGGVGHLESTHQVVPFLADLRVGVGEVALLVGNLVPFFLEDAFVHRNLLHLQFFRGDFIHFIVIVVIACRMKLQAHCAKRDQTQGMPESLRICCHDGLQLLLLLCVLSGSGIQPVIVFVAICQWRQLPQNQTGKPSPALSIPCY